MSATDVEGSIPLPDSPRLIVQGDTMAAAKWMISMEKRVMMSAHSNFVAALAAFSLPHSTPSICSTEEEASRNLEFIQRCFAGINPSTGSMTATAEVVSKKTQSSGEEETQLMYVCTLLRKIMDF